MKSLCSKLSVGYHIPAVHHLLSDQTYVTVVKGEGSLGSKVRYNLLSSFLEASSILSEGRLARNMSGISLILFFEMIRSSKLRSLLSTLGMEAIWLLGGKKKEGRGNGE